MRLLAACIKWIDRLADWSAKIIPWFGLALALQLGYETISRYAFNAPTQWSYDITYMLAGSLFILGATYTLRIDGHVRIEVFYKNLSPRGQAIIDLIGYLILFFPVMGLLFHAGTDAAIHSWEVGERSLASYWHPPLSPFKTIIPVAIFMLLCQGIANFVRCLFTIRNKSYEQ